MLQCGAGVNFSPNGPCLDGLPHSMSELIDQLIITEIFGLQEYSNPVEVFSTAWFVVSMNSTGKIVMR